MAELLSANQGDTSYKHPTGAEVKRGMVEQLICLLLAGCAGTFISMQASANGSFRKNLGDPAFASFFSICGTFITACSLMLLYRPPVPSMAAIRSTPWWNWIGGPLGAMIVLSGAALIPRLGAAAFISAVVAGQLLHGFTIRNSIFVISETNNFAVLTTIPKTMQAVVYRGVNDLHVETVPVPRIRADELLVRVDRPLADVTAEVEREAIRRALARHAGRVAPAAR